MIEVVTYHSQNVKNPNEAWIAYAVLPNGDLWQVRCNGATEDEAAGRARALLEREQAKVKAPVEERVNAKMKALGRALSGRNPAQEGIDAVKHDDAERDAKPVKGVYFHQKMKKWVANGKKPDGKPKYLGAFATVAEANNAVAAFQGNK